MFDFSWDKKRLVIECAIAIICAIIGVACGKASNTYYYNGQKITETELNTIMEENAEYRTLYNTAIKDNEILEVKIESLSKDNDNYKKVNSELTDENKMMKNQIDMIPTMEFKDFGLVISGEEKFINKRDSIVIIDGNEYYAKDFLYNLIPTNSNLSLKDNTVFVGRVIADKCNLFDKWIVDSKNCKYVSLATDSYGNKHSNVLFFEEPSCYTTYNLKSEYSFLHFSLAPHKDRATKGGADIVIKADDVVVYSKEITKTTETITEEIPINNCSLLTIECKDNRYEPVIRCVSDIMLFDAKLYN